MFKGQQHWSNANKTAVADSDKSHVITSEKSHDYRLKRPLAFGLVTLLIAGALVGSVLFYKYQKHRSEELGTPIPTAVEYAKNQSQDLEKHKPASDAPLQTKLAYYDKLRNSDDTAGDYKAAITAFLAREELSTDGLDYHDYYRLAQYYQMTGDKQDALKALDKADATIPPDNPAEGFYQASVVKNIERLRQELQS